VFLLSKTKILEKKKQKKYFFSFFLTLQHHNRYAQILGLAHLTYGNGLPASLEEVNMIHRMREKKAFEGSLPPITDEASFERRKKLLEAREMKEWALREAEMKQEQEDKLQVLNFFNSFVFQNSCNLQLKRKKLGFFLWYIS
jgi:hypothetical protein